MRRVVVTMVLTETSSELMPSLGTLAGTVGVAVAVAVFVVASIYAAGVVFGKFGWKFLDRIWEPREFAIIVAGAMVLGSASGAVTWSSANLYKIAAKPEQAVARPAYAMNNDCKPYTFKTADDVGKVEPVLGAETKAKLENNGFATGHMDFTETGEKSPSNVVIDFKPHMENDGSCAPDPDPCYQVKLSYEQYTTSERAGKRKTTEQKWVTPDGYDKAMCGDQDARQF